jgi:hypothetical protein
MSVLRKLHVINSKHCSLLHEQNVKEPYYFTKCGFSDDANFYLDGKANKMCNSGVLEIRTFSEKMHNAAKITVWASLPSHWTIKLLFLKKSWAVHEVQRPSDASICCDYLPIHTQCFTKDPAVTHTTNINLDLI